MKERLERRLTKLEAAQRGEVGNPEHQRDAEAFNAKLARIEANVRATDDFTHRSLASPAENFVRACLRGEPAEVCRSFFPR